MGSWQLEAESLVQGVSDLRPVSRADDLGECVEQLAAFVVVDALELGKHVAVEGLEPQLGFIHLP